MKHTFRKCLSLVLALATLLSVCVVPLTAAAPACDHYAHEDEWSYIGYQDPTCTEYGGHAYLCGHCNTRFIDHRTWKAPLNHKNQDGTSALTEISRVEPTLTEDGEVVYRCNLCGETVKTPLSATKCDTCTYDYVNTATCTTAGKKIGTCSVCGHVTEEAVAALGHAWNTGVVVVEPVCGHYDENNQYVDPVDAEILFTCTRAGCDADAAAEGAQAATKLETEIAPANHKWRWVDGAGVACSATPGYVCDYCDAAHPTEPYSEVSHNYQDYDDPTDTEHQNLAPGCEDGYKWQKCANCGDFKKVDLAADVYGNHVHPTDNPALSKLTAVTTHNCGNPGYMKCSVCQKDDIPNKYDPAAHNYTINVAPTCMEYGYKTCGVCGYTIGYLDPDGVTIHEEYNKLGHLLPTDPADIGLFEATCAERGYRVYLCQRPGCTGHNHTEITTGIIAGYVYEYTTNAALGHAWETVAKVDATCGQDGHEAGQECSRCHEVRGCATIPALTHNYQPARVPANCMYPAHDGQVCTNCGAENMDPNVMTNWDGVKDEDAHNWDDSREQLETAATCTTPGLVRKYCTVCKKEYSVEVQATGHNYVKIGSIPVTCQNAGMDIYYCDACDDAGRTATIYNAVETVAQGNVPTLLLDRYDSHAKYSYTYVPATGEFELVTDSHTWDTSTHVKFVGVDDVDDGISDATQYDGQLILCGVYCYEERTCSTCNINYNKRLEDSHGLTGEHVAVSADVAATCTQSGYIGRTVCARCATVIAAGTIDPAKHVFDTTAADYVGATAPTCTTIGWSEKGTCTQCGLSDVMNGEVPALGHKDAEGNYTLELVPARSAACGVYGYDEHYACTQCGYALLNAAVVYDADNNLDTTNVTVADFVADITVNGDNGYVAPLVHDFSGAVSFIPFACLEDGYAWTVCTREGCSEIEVKSYTYGYANHRYSDLSHATDVPHCADSYCDCQNMVQKNSAGNVVSAWDAALIICGYRWVIDQGDGHKNAAGETIDLSDCLNWADDQDHKCASCDVLFTIDDVNHHGQKVSERIDATCISYEYDLISCTRCKKVWTKMVNAQYGNHTMVTAPNSVAPTWTTLGSADLVCSLCGEVGEEISLKAADLFFEMDITNKFGGTVLVNGGYIAVTVKMSAPGTDVYSVKMGVKFNPDVLEWVASDSEVANIFGNNVTTVWCDNNGMNTVEIYAHAQKDAAGNMQNVTVNGTEEIVTIYFKVNPEYYDVTAPKSAVELEALDFGNIVVDTYDATAFDKATYNEGDEFVQITYDASVPATDADPIKVETQVYGANYPKTTPNLELNGTEDPGAYKLYIWKLGDLNNDAVVDTVDAAMFYEIIINADADYDAQADLNKDGEVNTADFILMKQYMVSKISYVEMAKA